MILFLYACVPASSSSCKPRWFSLLCCVVLCVSLAFFLSVSFSFCSFRSILMLYQELLLLLLLLFIIVVVHAIQKQVYCLVTMNGRTKKNKKEKEKRQNKSKRSRGINQSSMTRTRHRPSVGQGKGLSQCLMMDHTKWESCVFLLFS